MCGIVGLVNFDEQKVNPEVLKNMLGLINYRGPDECGIYVNGNVGLGNVRLSIIDLSTGQQPMCNEDKSLWIVYNGEVFNYIELRNDLKKQGVSFRTDSDTEVVLKYYEMYAEKCLSYFNGQFAFAIWDNKKKTLFMARDRMGIRPLYYSCYKNFLIFASEIKCILCHPVIRAELDIEALAEVYTLWTTLTPRTCFKNISEVPPGHYLSLSKSSITIKKYWELTFDQDLQIKKMNADEACEGLDAILTDAVKLRLRADVPVAAYLSGGLDSSTTTYLIKKFADNRLKTFSIGFEDKEYDEGFYQNEVSAFLNTNHTSFICSNKEIVENFPKVIWHTEFPLLRTAPVPMYLLSKHVRDQKIKVVITGEGADEMLGGYNIFKEMKIKRFWAKFPESKIRPLLLKRLYPYINSIQQLDPGKLKFFFSYKLNETHSPFYSHLLRWNNSSAIINYFNNDYKQLLSGFNVLNSISSILPENFNSWETLSQAQWLESVIFMSGYLLSSQGDRMGMANSVEGRYPFLDYRVIEYCCSLHPDLKLNGLNEKYILKKMMSGKIPESVIKRSKQAYRAPVRKAFITSETPSWLNELLDKDNINNIGLFEPLRVQQLISRLNSQWHSELDDMAISAILSTQILYNEFIKDFPKPKQPGSMKIYRELTCEIL